MPLSDVLGRRLAAIGKAALVVAFGVILYLGWRELYFLTDDAFITFRYIDHHRRGCGARSSCRAARSAAGSGW